MLTFLECVVLLPSLYMLIQLLFSSFSVNSFFSFVILTSMLRIHVWVNILPFTSISENNY